MEWGLEFDLKKYNIWFTADLHLFHENVIKHDGRPFKDIHEMHEYILNQWNNQIKPEDHVFILGDTIWKCSLKKIVNFNNNFNGIKHYILGNHDKEKYYIKACLNTEHTVDRLAKISVIYNNKKQEIILCHYPFESWEGINRRVWHLHGHIHNKELPKTHKKRLNVGWIVKQDIYSWNNIVDEMGYIDQQISKTYYKIGVVQ